MTTPGGVTAASRLVARTRRPAAGLPEVPIGSSPAAEPLAGTDGLGDTVVADAVPPPWERAARSAPAVPVSRPDLVPSPGVMAAAPEAPLPADTAVAFVDERADRPQRASEPVPERRRSPEAEPPRRGNVKLVDADPFAGDPTPPAAPAAPSQSSDVPLSSSVVPESAPSSPMARRLKAAAAARHVTSPLSRTPEAPPVPTTPTVRVTAADPGPRSAAGPSPSTAGPAPTSQRPHRSAPDVTRSPDADPRVVIGSIEVVTAPPRLPRPDPLAVLADRRRGGRNLRSLRRR